MNRYCKDHKHPTASHKNGLPSSDLGIEHARKDQINSAEPTDHKEYDLCQQWRMAEAAQQAVRAAYLQTMIGWLGLGGLIATVIYAAKAAFGAVDAASSAAKSVEDTVRIEQPIVLIHKIHPGEYGAPTVPIEFCISNFGKSPAILIEVFARSYLHDELPPHPPEVPEDLKPLAERVQGRVLEPGKPMTQRALSVPREDDFQEFTSGQTKKRYLFGHVIYEDIFGQKRKTGFGFQLLGAYVAVSRVGGKTFNYDIEIK